MTTTAQTRRYKIEWDWDLLRAKNGADFGTRQFFKRHGIYDASGPDPIVVDASIAPDLERVLDLDDTVISYEEVS